MKKIALFISSLQKGGSERVMVNLAEFFYRNHYDVLLVTQYKRQDEYEIMPEIKRVYSEPSQDQLQGNRLQNFMTRFRTLRRIWQEYKPDVILSFLGKNNLMAITTSRFLPVRTVVSVRGEPTMEYEGKLMQFLAKWLFRYADGVVLQTKMAMQFFPKRVRKKAVILPNPLNPLFVKNKYEGVREPLIVAVGRTDENKNHAMLIHAFARLASEYPNVKEKELTDRISLPGTVTNVAEHIYKAQIFALTSNTEGMPNSLMEAMALGLPVVSTDCPCGGPATLIEDGVNGLLVPVGDAYALADAFRKILSDSQYAQKLGDNAYKIVEELNPDKVNGEWRKYLSHIAHDKN